MNLGNNWLGVMNCLLHDAVEVKEVGRRTYFLDELRNRRRHWELHEEAEDTKSWKRQFITRTWTC